MFDLRKVFVSIFVFVLVSLCAIPAHASPAGPAPGGRHRHRVGDPRGIAFGPDGRVYVAEAGRGGNGNCVMTGDGQRACYGETGAIVRIDPFGGAAPERIVKACPRSHPPAGSAPADRWTCRSSAMATRRS